MFKINFARKLYTTARVNVTGSNNIQFEFGILARPGCYFANNLLHFQKWSNEEETLNFSRPPTFRARILIYSAEDAYFHVRQSRSHLSIRVGRGHRYKIKKKKIVTVTSKASIPCNGPNNTRTRLYTDRLQGGGRFYDDFGSVFVDSVGINNRQRTINVYVSVKKYRNFSSNIP